MDMIIGILVIIIYLLLAVYPILAAFPVLYSLTCYFQKGQPAGFYSGLRKYGLATVLYILLAVVLFSPSFEHSRAFYTENLFFLYFFILPLPIALYNIIIMKREYPEEIEKLIF